MTSLTTLADATNAATGSVILIAVVPVQPFTSVAVIVYACAVNPVNVPDTACAPIAGNIE